MPVAWFDRLVSILTLVEEDGVWPEAMLDAYIAMHDAWDSTPLGPAPFVCSSYCLSAVGLCEATTPSRVV